MEILITLSDAEVHAINTLHPGVDKFVSEFVKTEVQRIYSEVYKEQADALLDDPSVTTMPASRDEVVLTATLPSWLSDNDGN
jgi:hypothetical protein